MRYRYSWDSRKASANFRKHSVSFDEAASVFQDPSAAVFFDPEHSQDEEREIIIGHSLKRRILTVVFTERANRTIRIISARSASAEEQDKYAKEIGS